MRDGVARVLNNPTAQSATPIIIRPNVFCAVIAINGRMYSPSFAPAKGQSLGKGSLAVNPGRQICMFTPH